MKRRAIALLAGLFLLAVVPGSTLAANPANIDQSNAVGPATANDGGHQFGQTITTGKTGMFSSVDVWLGGTGVATVDIEAVDGSDHPTGPSLASGTGTIAAANWVNFAFGTPLAVTSGQRLAIVFTLGASQFAYGSDNGANTYTGGVAYWLNPQGSVWTALGLSPTLPTDLAFRTYVDPNATPAPTSTAAAATAPPAPTTPPTSTATGSTPAGGGVILFVPFGLLAAFLGLIVMASRRSQRRIS